MISKTSIGKSFGAIVNYCMEAKGEKKNSQNRGEIFAASNCCGNKNQIIQQFKDQKNINKRLKRATWHTSLSFAPQDSGKLNLSMMTEIAHLFAQEFGFEQFVAIRHKDTSFDHFHFIGNRVNLNSKTVSDSQNYRKTTAFCRKMEKKYELNEVLNPRKFLAKELKNLPRQDNRKMDAKEALQEILKTCKTVPELKDRLSQLGFSSEIQRGFAVVDKKSVRIKGSQMGYPLKRIQEILQNNLLNNLNNDKSKGRSRQLNIGIN